MARSAHGLGKRVREDAKEARREGRAQRPTGRGRGIRSLLAIGLVALLSLYGAALYFLQAPSPGRALSIDVLTRYTVCGSPQSLTNLDAGARTAYCHSVDHAVTAAHVLDEDHRITGSIAAAKAGADGRLVPTPGGDVQDFWTSYPSSDAATNDLLRNLFATGAPVTVDSQSLKQAVRFVTQFLLPLLILADLFALLFSLIQAGASGASEFLLFGRAGDKRLHRRTAESTTFADVAAADEAIVELAEVRDYLADPRAFAAMGALPPKGVLLFGPPGCGKTLLARAVAGEASAAFFSMSGSEFVESLVGVGAARVRDLFRQGRASAPAIIFIDELDAVGRQRGAGLGQGHDEREQTLNELLVQMDGFSATEGVVVMGATNRPDILDPALLRAGRFDRHVTVERPDVEGRLEILRLHARGRRLADPEGELPVIARQTPGFSGADLANVLNESALLAVREKAASIERRHLEEAVERVMSGPKRRGQIISREEKRCIAYHEAGHAIVAAAMGRAASVQKLSIIARGRGIGHLSMLQEDRTIFRRGDMEGQVAIAMAGFSAEEIVFGEPSTGSEQDLERATTIARDMAGRYGMSTRLGPVRVLRENREVFLGRDYLATRDVSQPTLEHLDAEVHRILEEQRNAARAILTAHRDVLDGLAGELVAQETLQSAELAVALRGVRPHLVPMPAQG